MNIKSKYATFEQAKLLKKKECNIICKKVYDKAGVVIDAYYGYARNDKDSEYSITITAPEQWQIIEWLRVEKGVWIEVYVDDDQTYGYLVTRFKENYRIDSPLRRGFASPQEAYSLAFDYILKELI